MSTSATGVRREYREGNLYLMDGRASLTALKRCYQRHLPKSLSCRMQSQHGDKISYTLLYLSIPTQHCNEDIVGGAPVPLSNKQPLRGHYLANQLHKSRQGHKDGRRRSRRKVSLVAWIPVDVPACSLPFINTSGMQGSATPLGELPRGIRLLDPLGEKIYILFCNLCIRRADYMSLSPCEGRD